MVRRYDGVMTHVEVFMCSCKYRRLYAGPPQQTACGKRGYFDSALLLSGLRLGFAVARPSDGGQAPQMQEVRCDTCGERPPHIATCAVIATGSELRLHITMCTPVASMHRRHWTW